MPSERDRTRLIAELASLLHDGHLPEDARCASLTLIGWLARRMPGESACSDGVEHARRQLEPCGTLEASRASRRSIGGGRAPGRSSARETSTTVAVRVESRALLVRSRRGRPGGPGDDGHSPRSHDSAEAVLTETQAFGPNAEASVPRPHGRKAPGA
jgi:hypothetical protein